MAFYSKQLLAQKIYTGRISIIDKNACTFFFSGALFYVDSCIARQTVWSYVPFNFSFVRFLLNIIFVCVRARISHCFTFSQCFHK